MGGVGECVCGVMCVGGVEDVYVYMVLWCVCDVWVCLCVVGSVCVCTLAYIHVEARGQPQRLFFKRYPSLF